MARMGVVAEGCRAYREGEKTWPPIGESMIVKELDAMPDQADTITRAGRVAEEQLAFYLRRAFADDPAIRVLNGLRGEHAGRPVQGKILC